MSKVSTNVKVKDMVSSAIESIRKVFRFIDKNVAIDSEKHKDNSIEVEYREHLYKLRLDSIRCILMGPQQVIVCYDQYTGKII